LNSQNWLTLLEYSAKYRVSISTLRRKIKAGELEFQFNDGKYLLKDMPAPSGSEVVAPPTVIKPQGLRNQETSKNLKLAPPPLDEETTLNPTVEILLSEIKKAYGQILQEKEEQILLLRSEVSDLKTLISVLEEQNTELKAVGGTTTEDHGDPKFELDLEL
jgi:hypothetical protein